MKKNFLYMRLFVCIVATIGRTVSCAAPPRIIDPQEPTLYIKNSSSYTVRLAAGPEYPSSMALFPGQIIEFPLKNVPCITASTYGKVSHYLTGLVAELNIAKLLQERTECAKSDCFINITYQKEPAASLWQIARYLLTQGTWSLTMAPVNRETDLAGYLNPGGYGQALYEIIAHSCESIAEPIARDTALIWSMFPRAAAKIELKQTVYPFNILGLDIGGLIASDRQLRNWGSLLSQSLRKRFASIGNPAIWNAVNMIIADSIESLRHHNYYTDRSLDYPITLLHIPTPDVQEVDQTAGPLPELITQLREKMGADMTAHNLIGQIEQMARLHAYPSQTSPIPVPPPPPTSPIFGGSFQRREVTNFLRELEKKRAEEQSLMDKVALECFTKIDTLSLEQEESMRLKYALLDKLRLIAQSKHALVDLSKIRDFLSPAILQLVKAEQNQIQTLQNWLGLLVRSEREQAYAYAHMEEKSLQQVYKDQIKQFEYQSMLMSHLREQIKRFGAAL